MTTLPRRRATEPGILTAPAPRTLAAAGPALGLYVHWPFCQSKCPYCDFNAHPLDDGPGGQRQALAGPANRWPAAYDAELAALVAQFGARPLTSIFFGGGTPSLMPPETVAAVIDSARRRCGFRNDIEITLEANPGSSDAGRFAAYRAAGVNRLSLGVQALDDRVLRFFERQHDAAQARRAIQAAQQHFDNLSADLIYARPGQDPADWRRELAEALAFGLPHLSLYQLTIEPGTRFEADVRRGLFTPLEDEEAQLALWQVSQDSCAAAGLENYEVSNFARAGAACRHNLIYWRGEDYFGIGPGAHGRVSDARGTQAFRMHRVPTLWIERVERAGVGLSDVHRQSPVDRAFERLMMGLRISEGLALTEVEGYLDPRALAQVVAAGFMIAEPGRLRLTDSGRLRLNAVFQHIWKGQG